MVMNILCCTECIFSELYRILCSCSTIVDSFLAMVFWYYDYYQICHICEACVNNIYRM